MENDFFIEKLHWFKQNEKPEVVLVIADNLELIKIIIGWTNLDLRHTDSIPELNNASENEIWEGLWKNTKVNLTELKEKTGVPYSESVLESKLKPLIGNHILYPDGTINSFAQRYLRERVLKLFESKLNKPNKRPT
jgi:hypothetical protein